MKNGIKITPAGEVEVIDFSKPDELSVLQTAVGGWVQAIDLSNILSSRHRLHRRYGCIDWYTRCGWRDAGT